MRRGGMRAAWARRRNALAPAWLHGPDGFLLEALTSASMHQPASGMLVRALAFAAPFQFTAPYSSLLVPRLLATGLLVTSLLDHQNKRHFLSDESSIILRPRTASDKVVMYIG